MHINFNTNRRTTVSQHPQNGSLSDLLQKEAVPTKFVSVKMSASKHNVFSLLTNSLPLVDASTVCVWHQCLRAGHMPVQQMAITISMCPVTGMCTVLEH